MPGKTESDKVDERGNEPDQRDDPHDGNVTERIAVELEAIWLREKHRANQCALCSRKSSPCNDSQRNGFIIVHVLRPSGSDNFRTAEKEVFGDMGVHGGGAEVQIAESFVGEWDLGHGDGFAYLCISILFEDNSQYVYRPVNMLSFTMVSPDSRMQSHGTKLREGSENSKTSPGTRSWEDTERPVGVSKYANSKMTGR